jgi:hypothetical protein
MTRFVAGAALACALLFGSVSCTRLLKPATPTVIDCCHYTADEFQRDWAAYKAAASPEIARQLRDAMVYHIIYEIDDVFGRYETAFLKGRSTFGIAGEGLQAGLAASATAVNGARGKTIIAAVLSGVTGVDLSLDKHLFAQQTFQAIASSMEARRNRIHERILTRLANETTATYPFDAARTDLAEYFYAGTLAGGLQELEAQTGTQAKESGEKLNARMVAAATQQDVMDATALNRALRQALSGNPSNDLGKARAFLKSLGETSADTMTPDQLWHAYQSKYSEKIVHDLAYRKLAFDSARSLGLIP